MTAILVGLAALPAAAGPIVLDAVQDTYIQTSKSGGVRSMNFDFDTNGIGKVIQGDGFVAIYQFDLEQPRRRNDHQRLHAGLPL